MGYHARVLRALSFIMVLLAAWQLPARAGDVLTQHNNNQRTGTELGETILSPKALRAGTFGKLWTLFADGQIVAQPLYIAKLAVDTTSNPDTPPVKGTFNTVVIATMHNTVYAYDADNQRRGPDGRTVPLWAKWLGPPRPSGKDIDMWSTNDPEWGILGTPVISDDRKTLYVVAWNDDGPQGIRYKLHALDLSSGADRKSVVIGVSSTDQPCKRESAFNPCTQKQRSALLLSNGVLYIGFGGDGSRGAMYAFDAASLMQKAVWSTTPTGVDGGIWQSGQGPAVDAGGNIYLMTANGTFDADNNGKNYGDSFVKLHLDGQNLVVKDYFTPCDQDFLRVADLDLGSSGPVLIPGNPPLIIGGGKEGILYVLSQSKMGGYLHSPQAPNCQSTNALQQLMAFPPVLHDGQTHYGNIHGAPVYWKGPDVARIYAWGENSKLKAFALRNGRLDAASPKQSTFQPPIGMPGGMISLTSDGSKAGTGIVWAVVPLDGDANRQRGVHGIVLALNAEDVSQTLWTSEQVAARDRLGLFAKFVPPTVAGGKLFVATYGDAEPLRTYAGNRPAQLPANYYVTVYGVNAAAPPHQEVVNQNSADVSVVRAATEPLTLDTATCRKIDADSLDCTDALSQKIGRPSFRKVIVAPGQDLAGCALLRVIAAGKNDGLRNASGIGFWSSLALAGNQAAEDSGRFVPLANLVSVGTGALKSGAAATLFEFVGVANCAASNAADSATLFKPYMQFENFPDGRIYRNWDLAGNYLIGPQVTQFDRTQDVLQ
jgi:outer membrane protein assembly factor BamB